MPRDIGDYWNDVRAHRKRKSSKGHDDPCTPECHDWYLHSGNIHFARDASAFTSYLAIPETTLGSLAFAQRIRAVGIGTVELQVKSSPGSNTVRTITLKDVFHIPTAVCNGLSEAGIGIEHGLTMSYGSPYWTMRVSGPEQVPFCYGVWDRLLRLERADGLVGSPLRDSANEEFSISTSVDQETITAFRQAYEAQYGGRRG